MTKPEDGATTGGSPAEVVDISAGQSDGGGTLNPTSKPTWQPNPNPRHADFAPGNAMARTHGANSLTFVRERARPMAADLVRLASWLGASEFEPDLENLAKAIAETRILADSVRALTDAGKAVPPRQWEQLASFRRLVHKISTDMGLSAVGRARLAALTTSADIGQATLADLAEQGRQTSGYKALVEGEPEDGGDDAA